MNIRTFFLFLAVPVCAGLILAYLNQSAPDVRYSLSERIPVSFASPPDGKAPDDKASPVVQQIEVKNVGTLKADKVLVKIRGHVTGHKLSRYSAADDAKVTAQPRSFEVEYPSLPPGASFQLSIKSEGDGIGPKELSVSDSHGPARDALSSTNTSWVIYAYWLSIALYLLLCGLSIRSSAIGLWKIRKGQQAIDVIASSGKPFYMSEKEWGAAVVEALKDRMQRAYVIGREFDKHAAYHFLQLDKPEGLRDDAAWKACTEMALAFLKNAYREALNHAFTENHILAILEIGKPKHFPESQWLELQDAANKEYVKERKKAHLLQDEAIKCLREVKPSRISLDSWETLIDYWERLYFLDVIEQLIFANDVQSYGQSVDASRLTQQHQELLRIRIEGALNRKRSESRAALLQKLIVELLDGKGVPPDKPAAIEEYEWANIKRIQEQVERHRSDQAASEANSKKESELKALEIAIGMKQKKVDRQLAFIHEVLNDPTAIDRVEDYNDTFAKGNFDNLKRLAQAAVQPQDGAPKRRRRQTEES